MSIRRIILLSLLVITSQKLAYSDVASLQSNYVAGEANIINHLNNDRTTLANSVNNVQGCQTGSVQSAGQVKAGTVCDENMYDDASPHLRTYEGAACEFVYTGLLPTTTSGTLVGNIPSGTAYPRGYRVVKSSSTAHTFGASLWTYIDLDQTGTFLYQTQTIGGSAPSVSTNAIRLARVSTDSSQIIAVQDLRKTSCATGPFSAISDVASEGSLATIFSSGKPLSTSNDVGFVQGLRVSWDTVTTFKVTAGSAYINGKYRGLSTDTTVTQSLDAPLTGGSGLDTGAIASSTKYNVFAVADQDGVTTPSFSYSAGTTPNGITNARKIGEIWTDSTSLFTSKDLVVTSSFDEKQLVGGFAHFNGSNPPGIYQGYNVSGVTRLAAGRYRVDWNSQFASGDQIAVFCHSGGNAGNINSLCHADPQTSENTGNSAWVRVTNTAGTEGDNNALHVYVMAVGARKK